MRNTVGFHPAFYRTMLALLAVVLAVVLYAWLVQWTTKGRAQANAAVSTLREQSARLEQQAAEYERLRTMPVATASTSDLETILEAQSVHAGLTRASMRIDSLSSNRIQIKVEAVSFSGWLTMVTGLQSTRLRLESCHIEAMPTPGFVSVTATIVRDIF